MTETAQKKQRTAASTRPQKTPFWKATIALTMKDLRIEARGRELINAMVLFAVMSVLIFSFALELDKEARETAITGVWWVTIVFAGNLGLSRSLAAEKDRGSLDALLLSPVDRSALFFGKMFSNLIFMLTVAVLLMFLSTILFNISLFKWWLVALMLLGTLGLATVGTLLASMAVHTRARETMLPILMLPIVLPIILCAVKGSTAALSAAPLEDWVTWPQLLFVADIVLLAMAYVLFDFVVEE